MKNNLKILALFFALPFISANIGDSSGCIGYGMMSGTYGYFGGIFMMTIGLLFIVALVLLIVWLMKQIQDNGSTRKKKK